MKTSPSKRIRNRGVTLSFQKDKGNVLQNTSSSVLDEIDVTDDIKTGKEILFIAVSNLTGPDRFDTKGIEDAIYNLNTELEGIGAYPDEKKQQDVSRKSALELQKELRLKYSKGKKARPDKKIDDQKSINQNRCSQ